MMFVKEFHAAVYPFYLWVTVEPTFEEFSQKFQRMDWNLKDAHEFTKEEFEGDKYIRGVTHIVQERQSGVFGACIRITKPEAVCADLCAHEGSHVCDFMCDVFDIGGFTYDLGEPRAYITGWVANCIEVVVNVWNENREGASDNPRSVWHDALQELPELETQVLVRDYLNEYHIGKLTDKGWSIETWLAIDEREILYWKEIE